MKEPIPVAEFEEIVTDTDQQSKREMLDVVLGLIVDVEERNDIDFDGTGLWEVGYNQANKDLRERIIKLRDSV